jgi:hypothetical protein
VSKASEDASTLPRVQIILQGDFSSLSADIRWSAKVSLAAILGISPQEIELLGVYEL